MAKREIAYRDDGRRFPWHLAAISCALALVTPKSTAAGPVSSPAPVALAGMTSERHWMSVPRVSGRLTAKDIGLVINIGDPYSVEVGEFYIHARRLAPEQVLRLEVPSKAVLTPDEFQALKASIDAHFDGRTQALALAWTQPYAVQCNAITGALALGYDGDLCAHTCAPSKPSPYFNARTARPYADLKLRPSMLLAARDVDAAKALIQRGVEADGSLGRRGAPPVQAHFVATSDTARNTRAPLFPPAGIVRDLGIMVHLDANTLPRDATRLLLVETGAARVEQLDTLSWVPGGLGDHLTSFGGLLGQQGGQTTALDWIASGATASYGTVSEPCSHPQKFPHPQVLLLHYAQGSSAIEAYWKSVAWPQQGVFVGEPLAAPFAR
jgi:uncharacterized protein (TIGR03790 family)